MNLSSNISQFFYLFWQYNAKLSSIMPTLNKSVYVARVDPPLSLEPATQATLYVKGRGCSQSLLEMKIDVLFNNPHHVNVMVVLRVRKVGTL